MCLMRIRKFLFILPCADEIKWNSHGHFWHIQCRKSLCKNVQKCLKDLRALTNTVCVCDKFVFVSVENVLYACVLFVFQHKHIWALSHIVFFLLFFFFIVWAGFNLDSIIMAYENTRQNNQQTTVWWYAENQKAATKKKPWIGTTNRHRLTHKRSMDPEPNEGKKKQNKKQPRTRREQQ